MKTILLVIVGSLALSLQAEEPKKAPKKDGQQALNAKILEAEQRLAKIKAGAAATATSIAKTYKEFNAGEIQLEVAGQARTDDLENYDKSLTLGANYWVTAGAGVHAAVGLRDLNEQFVDRVEFGLVGRVPVDKLRFALLFGIGAEWQRIAEWGGTNDRGASSASAKKKPKPGDDDCDGDKDPDPPSNPNPPGDKDPQDDLDRLTHSNVDDWAVYAEIGPLFRLNKHLDIFFKVRGVRPINSADREHIALIAGSDYTF